MTSRDFCFWLQGFFEINNHSVEPLTGEQAVLIRKHLALVFAHEIDPSMGGKEQQDKLNTLHDRPRPSGPPGDPFGPPLMRC